MFTRSTITSKRDRLPGLDGLRACAIVEVMVSHLAMTNRLPWVPISVMALLGMRGGWGVTVFFVISGFLITYLLVLEETRTGRIALGSFYARRALRILPPGLAYLAVIAVAAFAGWISVTHTDILSSLFFFRNLINSPDVYTAHFWSLSIEEQFYLAWPLTLRLVPPSRRIALTAVLCAAAPFWRWWNQASAPNWARADLRYDTLLTGALMALLASDLKWAGVIDRVLRRPTAVFIGALVVLCACLYAPSNLPGAIALLLLPLQLWAMAVIVLIVSRGECAPVQAFLNWGPVTWVGRLSYSLYLWQQPFLRVAGTAVVKSFPLDLAFTVGAGSLSYYLIERPCARLRDHFRRIRGVDARAFPADSSSRG
jgi:peptidoglycan/LPS O-acetylase OafA/YrhL